MTYQEFTQRYKYDVNADKLGEGGFGKVFKAYDTYRHRWVAIKIAPVSPDHESVRLKKEVEIVGKLPPHPNVAYYEDCYTFTLYDGEVDFGILQYYEEGNLLNLMKKGILTAAQKTAVLAHILGGLDFLHSNGIIHRDLKPQNILIVLAGGEYIPLITDFGISKRLDVDKSSVFSNSLVGAGTLAYSSPEQLKETTIRKNTDLWSFGVIAFQVWDGGLPFTTGGHSASSQAGRMELFRQIDSGVLPDGIARIPEPWQTLIRRCLTLDADSRLKNCAECRDVLLGVAPFGGTGAGVVDEGGDETLKENFSGGSGGNGGNGGNSGGNSFGTGSDDTIRTDPPASEKKKTPPVTPPPPPPPPTGEKPKRKFKLWQLVIGIIGLGLGGYGLYSSVNNTRIDHEFDETYVVVDTIYMREAEQRGVDINGVTWATCNVDSPGTFAARPESAGMFYQWNRRKGWPATGDVSGWDSTTPSGDKWEKANDPCPNGWRVPTEREMELLVDAGSEWATVNGVAGCRFGSGNNIIFLPAADYRYYSSGLLGNVGSYGYYWSAGPYNATNGRGLGFYSGSVSPLYDDRRSNGFSIRCVADEEITQHSEQSDIAREEEQKRKQQEQTQQVVKPQSSTINQTIEQTSSSQPSNELKLSSQTFSDQVNEPQELTQGKQYDRIDDYHNGMAIVGLNGKYGYIDTSGNEVIPLRYEYAMKFEDDGTAKVKLNDNIVLIDKTGKVVSKEGEFILAEELPSFMGDDGGKTFAKWCNDRIGYPVEAHEKGIQGKVIIRFYVEKDGSVTVASILEDPHPLLTKEVIRVIELSPNWKPAMQRGIPVRVTFTFPYTFQLTN